MMICNCNIAITVHNFFRLELRVSTPASSFIIHLFNLSFSKNDKTNPTLGVYSLSLSENRWAFSPLGRFPIFNCAHRVMLCYKQLGHYRGYSPLPLPLPNGQTLFLYSFIHVLQQHMLLLFLAFVAFHCKIMSIITVDSSAKLYCCQDCCAAYAFHFLFLTTLICILFPLFFFLMECFLINIQIDRYT